MRKKVVLIFFIALSMLLNLHAWANEPGMPSFDAQVESRPVRWSIDDYDNIAAGKQVEVSSTYSLDFSAANAVDNAMDTFWAASTANQTEWILLDLGVATDIDGIGAYWFDKYYAVSYKLALSMDKKTWSYAIEENNGIGTDIQIFKPMQCRYVGLLLTAKNDLTYVIRELQVYKHKDAIIQFADANLEQVVRDALQKPAGDIMQSDVVEISALQGFNKNISDLTGLEYFTNLEHLYLNNNYIMSLEPLAGLTKLQYLFLEDNEITDMSPLQAHTQLRVLTLTGNNITDIGTLNTTGTLSGFYIENNGMSFVENDVQGDINRAAVTTLTSAGTEVRYTTGNITTQLPTATPIITPEPSVGMTATPTVTATPTATPVITSTPTPTTTILPTATPTSTATPTPLNPFKNYKVISTPVNPIIGLRACAPYKNYLLALTPYNGMMVLDISEPGNTREVGLVDVVSNGKDIRVRDDHLFIAAADKLYLYDIQDVLHPILITEVVMPGFANALELYKDFMLVTESNRGLCIVDISDITNVRVTKLVDTPGSASDITVNGNYAFISDGETDGIQVYDLSAGMLVHNIPIASSVVLSHGNYLFSGIQNTGISIIDMSTIDTPIVVKVVYMPDVEDMQIKGDYLYVNDGRWAAEVVDISDPANAEHIKDLPAHGAAKGIYVTDYYAYYTAGDSILSTFDITGVNGAHSISAAATLDKAQDVRTVGDYAYVADGTAGVHIMNVTDPTNIILEKTIDTPGFADAITVQGNYAFVADGNAGMQIIDITTVSDAKLLKTVDTDGYADDVVCRDDKVFIADGITGIKIVDITNIHFPSIISFIDTAGNAEGLFLQDNYLYVADNNSGIVIFDISQITKPVMVTTVSTLQNAHALAISGNYAYVVGGYGLLSIFDISDIHNITMAKGYDVTGYTTDITINGHYAFITSNKGLRIYDIIDINTVAPVNEIETEADTNGIHIAGDYLYMANGTAGLRIIDIGVANNMNLIEKFAPSGEGKDVVVRGNYAYVADGYAGFQIIDVTDVKVPVIVKEVYTGKNALRVFVKDTYAYVIESEYPDATFLRIIDISTIEKAHIVKTIELPPSAYNICVDERYAYVGGFKTDLHIIDISNIADAAVVATYYAKGGVQALDIQHNYAFMADYDEVVYVLDISDIHNIQILNFFKDTYYISDIYASGNYVLYTGRHTFNIIDITDIYNTKLIHSIEHSQYDYLEEIYAEGNYIFMSTHNGNDMHMYDISDISAPRYVHSLYMYDSGERFTVRNGIIYRPGEGDGLTIYGNP